VARYYMLFPHPNQAVFLALVKLLREIFNDKKPFYGITYRILDWPYMKEVSRKNLAQAQGDAALFHTSRYQELLLFNGYAFGLVGFMEVIASISRLRVPFSQLIDIVSLFQCFSSYFNHLTRTTLLPSLRDVIFGILLNMSEEELRPINNADIDALISGLEELELQSRRVHSKVYETFLLDFSLKCLRCSILPKRLHAIDSIDQIAQTSLQQEQLRQYHDVRFAAEACITPAELSVWLVQHGILVIIFGKRTHEELIRRSKDILLLLARQDALTDELMELVWDRGMCPTT
jgi:hypothetical protein